MALLGRRGNYSADRPAVYGPIGSYVFSVRRPRELMCLRPIALAISLSLLVVPRYQSAFLIAMFTVLGVATATRTSTRGAVATLGLLTLVGVPWIASASISGLIWFVLENQKRALDVVKRGIRRSTAAGFALASLLGLLAGSMVVPLVQAQVRDATVQIPIIAPPAWVVALAVVAFALANAIGEELLWRGAILSESSQLGLPMIFVVQAASFGLAHLGGLPGGWAGCLLTGLASVLFVLIHRRLGMVASVAAHLLADLAIFTSVAPLVLFTGWSAG